jgi:hypothetical protein
LPGCPCSISVVATLLLLRIRLDEKEHRRIRFELERR